MNLHYIFKTHVKSDYQRANLSMCVLRPDHLSGIKYHTRQLGQKCYFDFGLFRFISFCFFSFYQNILVIFRSNFMTIFIMGFLLYFQPC